MAIISTWPSTSCYMSKGIDRSGDYDNDDNIDDNGDDHIDLEGALRII